MSVCKCVKEPTERGRLSGRALVLCPRGHLSGGEGVCPDTRLIYSQRYLVVGLALWLASGLALPKYCCKFVNLNCISAT